MASLQSDKVRRALVHKLGCEEEADHADIRYVVYDETGRTLCYTLLSHGPKHDLRSPRVSGMARQLCLTRPEFVQLVSCTLSGKSALEIIAERTNDP